MGLTGLQTGENNEKNPKSGTSHVRTCLKSLKNKMELNKDIIHVVN